MWFPQSTELLSRIIYYNNVVVQTEKVHHSRKFLHTHPTDRPRTNSRLKAHICPILPIQFPSSNSSSSSRKFLRKKVLSREFHLTGPRDMSTSYKFRRGAGLFRGPRLAKKCIFGYILCMLCIRYIQCIRMYSSNILFYSSLYFVNFFQVPLVKVVANILSVPHTHQPPSGKVFTCEHSGFSSATNCAMGKWIL